MEYIEQQHQDAHTAKVHCFRTFGDGHIEYNQRVKLMKGPHKGGSYYFYPVWERDLWAGCPYWAYYEKPALRPSEAAKMARDLASACIKEAREIDRKNWDKFYYTHRDIDLIPCREDGERCADGSAEPDYTTLKEISGKRIQEALDYFSKHYPDFYDINICGGLNCFESQAVFFESRGDDYEPNTDGWEFQFRILDS